MRQQEPKTCLFFPFLVNVNYQPIYSQRYTVYSFSSAITIKEHISLLQKIGFMRVSVHVSYMYLLPVCIRVWLTFIRMLFKYSYITCMSPVCYPNVPVWCFSEDHSGPYTV